MATEMREIKSVEEFKSLIAQPPAEAAAGAVVHFGASWCAPCSELNDALKAVLLPVYAGVGVVFYYADVETVGEVCESEGIESVPFVCFYRRKDSDGTLDRVADVAGAKMDEIHRNLVSLFGKGNDDKAKFENVDDYIRALLKRDKIMVFITGTPSRPRCGFTRKIVGLLDEYKAHYSYFDIMSDGPLCERLKTFSNWPTFPQVYVDGELIGGCDVCTQMHEEGELRSALKL